MQCGRRRRLLKPPVSQADWPRSGAPEAATRLQVDLRVGRLTLALTVADRWECSQATGLPAWRHQDLHITANRAHGIRALKQKILYLGTGPGWTLSKSM